MDIDVKEEPSASSPMKRESGRGSAFARGASESVPEFLSRLPPSTTKAESVGPWIWVDNPHDKVSNAELGDRATLIDKGQELLYAFENEKARLEAEHDKSKAKTKAGLTRKLNPLRRTLEQDLFALARETGITAGKWMLFPTPDQVDQTWKTVATAVVEGELGIGAKVAADDGLGGARLIAMYTRDYADKSDVKRVLERLVDLGLVAARERPIYYKCDVLTYLNIMGNNPYGLKASMCSSRDVLSGKLDEA